MSARTLVVAAALAAAGAGSARAQSPEPAAIEVRASIDPSTVLLGAPVTYRGQVVFPDRPSGARWLPPNEDADLTWGALAPRWVRPRAGARGVRDTLAVTATLRIFRTGTVVLPGLRFRTVTNGRTEVRRLPAVSLVVTPVLSAADSNADLRPPRGPMAAPWWERVPWPIVAIAIAALVLIVLGVRWWRRRRARAVPPAAAAPLDAAGRALADLAALKALHLPEHGRFGEHALRLTRIVRCYLEVATRTPRPGHTSAELVAALERTRVREDDRRLLAALMRVWDRVKFAQGSSTLEEATRAEEVVEALIRQLAAPAAAEPEPGGKAA